MRLFRRPPAPLKPKLEWVYVACTTWFTIGLFLDGWAHNHIPELETFFTPWHAVFYAGYVAIVCTLAVVAFHSKKNPPPGYREAAIGAGIFFAGAIGDLLWHEIFGVEKDIEALFSPTHLVLALGAVLMLGAPWLSIIRRNAKPKTLMEQLPALLSLTYIASAIMFLTQFHHWSDLRLLDPSPLREFAEMQQAISMAGYLWHIAILMAALFLLMRTLPMRIGSATILFTISTFGMSIMRMDTFLEAIPLICIAYVAGFITDLWAKRIVPIEKNLVKFRWFSAAVPALLIALLHAYEIPLYGTWWSFHLWSGAVAVVAGVGVLLGLVLVPPAKK